MIQAAKPFSGRADHPHAAAHSVVEIAQQRLQESPYRVLRLVKCRFHEGVLSMTGEVPTFYMKQIAQTLVRNLDQVEQLDNRINVAS